MQGRVIDGKMAKWRDSEKDVTRDAGWMYFDSHFVLLNSCSHISFWNNILFLLPDQKK
jgi:hypothetical protein